MNNQPKLEQIKIPEDQRMNAIHELLTQWRLPNGQEVIGKRAVGRFHKQMLNGYYYQLVWPSGTTNAEVTDWFLNAEKVVRYHLLGLL